MKKSFRRVCITLFLPLMCCHMLNGNGLHFPSGARQSAMGRSSVALSGFWSVKNNQAGMAGATRVSAGISYENRFQVKGLGLKNAAIIAPLAAGVLGITLSHFGDSRYSEIQTGVAFARNFGPRFRAGLQLDYLVTTMGDGYGSLGSLTFEAGIQVMVSRQIVLGVWAFNPLNIQMNRSRGARLPVIIKAGVCWKISGKLLATLETEKNSLWKPVIVRGGLEYAIKQKFYLRGGITTSREIFTMGFGWKLRKMDFAVAANMHQSLGISTQVSLNFTF